MRHFYHFIESMGYPSLSKGEHLPLKFEYHHDTYLLEDVSKLHLRHYLMSKTLYRNDFGDPKEAELAIAFSFGDGVDVNRHLAQIAREVHFFVPEIELYLQHEIGVISQITASHLISSDQYQTTYDVANFVAQRQNDKNILVIAQAWHAPRCIETCQQLGFTVKALRVVNAFPINDPQPWVRNPINWVIKESHRNVASGSEISERYQLD